MWQMYFNLVSDRNIIDFNIIALLLTLFIDRQLKKIKDQDLEKQLYLIGKE